MRLEIFISTHCFNCDEAYAIAEAVQDIAGMDVAVVNIDDPDSVVSSSVMAVPTYMLDGRVIALGNPEKHDFIHQLQLIQEFGV